MTAGRLIKKIKKWFNPYPYIKITGNGVINVKPEYYHEAIRKFNGR